MKVRIIQIPYTGYISASWYNREESYLEQLEVFSNCSFLIAQNMLLHLRIKIVCLLFISCPLFPLYF